MAELITKNGRKAIIKMAEISQVARVLSLVPKPEDFALKVISDMRKITNMVNNISIRIDEILDRYSSIPTEFLLKGFDEILDKLNDINDYSKFAISEVTNVMSETVRSAQEITDALNDAATSVTSAVLQVGGGVAYGVVGLSADITLIASGNGSQSLTNDVINDVVNGKISVSDMEEEIDKRVNRGSIVTINDNDYNLDKIADSIRKGTEEVVENSTKAIDNFFGNGDSDEEDDKNGFEKAQDWIDKQKEGADDFVDGTIGEAIKKVENAKKLVEEKIEEVKEIFNNLTKKFDHIFGFLGKHEVEQIFSSASKTAYEKMDTPVYDAVGELTGDVADFIANFNIGKVVTAIGGLAIGAGAATLAMDLLPSINIDRMLRDIINGIDTNYHMDKTSELYNNKYYGDGPELEEYNTDIFWEVGDDEMKNYLLKEMEILKNQPYTHKNNYKYENYKDLYEDVCNENRSEIYKQLTAVEEIKDDDGNSTGRYKINKTERKQGKKTNRKKRKEIRKRPQNERHIYSDDYVLKYKKNGHKYKSAIKEMRKIRRNVIKAKQIEKYKGFLTTELKNLEREFKNIGNNIKYEWDSMTNQYKVAVDTIKKFFSKEGCGGREAVDKCCDRINDDAEQIKELCKNIGTELTSVVTNIGVPYAVGTCVDMPVHKILEFFKDLKIILTFIKNLIRLGIDIISQLTILAKIVANGIQSISEILKTLKEILGVDKILNMIDYIIELFRPKMSDAKMLLENSLSPIYYNETEDYEKRVEEMENILEDDKNGNSGYVNEFYSTDNPYAKKKDKDSFGGKGNEEEVEEWLEELEAKGEREVVAYRSPILNAEGDDFAGWIYYYANARQDYLAHVKKEGKKRRRNNLMKKAAKKNKKLGNKLIGGVAQLRRNDTSFKFNQNKATGFDAYFWYIYWTTDPTDCVPDMSNVEVYYDEDGKPQINPSYQSSMTSQAQSVLTTSNGSLVKVVDGTTEYRVFVKDEIVKSGDIVTVNGNKYRVK